MSFTVSSVLRDRCGLKQLLASCLRLPRASIIGSSGSVRIETTYLDWCKRISSGYHRSIVDRCGLKRPSNRYPTPTRHISSVLRDRCGLKLLVSLFLIYGVVHVHGTTSRSARVQHDGISRTAVVLAIRQTIIPNSGVKMVSVYASFTPPVEDRSLTVVHHLGSFNRHPGSRISVLIDPEHPGYAEIAGSPYTPYWLYIGVVAFGVGWVVFVLGYRVGIGRFRSVSPPSSAPSPSPSNKTHRHHEKIPGPLTSVAVILE